MGILTGFPETWTTLGAPTAAAELWMCTEGTVEISFEAAPQTPDGIRLEAGRGMPISAGKTPKYRRVGSSPGVIRREAN